VAAIGRGVIILAMNATSTSSRLLLVADGRSGSPTTATSGIRRFRLARLPIVQRPLAAPAKGPADNV
jgi:hypothetical protein